MLILGSHAVGNCGALFRKLAAVTVLGFASLVFSCIALECPPPGWLPSSESGCPCDCNGVLPAACVYPCASSFALCSPNWKSSLCRKTVTVTVNNLPQTSTTEGGPRYVFGHRPYQALETYLDSPRSFQNYDTYTGGIVQFDSQRKTEVETYPGGIVEFDQRDLSNSWHPLQIVDAVGNVVQTATGSSQRPQSLIFSALPSHAGKTFRFKDSLHGPSLALGLTLRVVAQGIAPHDPSSSTDTRIFIRQQAVGAQSEIIGLSGAKANTTVCTPEVIPSVNTNNLCMSTDVTVSLNNTEVSFQSTACADDGFLQQYKMSVSNSAERHSTTSIKLPTGPIGMAVDGTFIFGHNSSLNFTGGCKKQVDAHGRFFYDSIPLCLLKSLGGTVPPEDTWNRALDQNQQNLHEWVRVWPAEGDPSPLIGYAVDGLPIYGPYGEDGKLMGWGGVFPSKKHPWYNVDSHLDSCNGRTRRDGSYAYYMTPSPPYTVGCLREKQGRSTALHLDLKCKEDHYELKSNETNGISTNTTATMAGVYNAHPSILLVPPPNAPPSPMALAAAIQAAPADIKPLLDDGVNASSDLCSNIVGVESLCLCLKVDSVDKYCAGFCSTSFSGYIGTVSDGYDGAVEITGWSCFHAKPKYVPPVKFSYECLSERSQAKVILVDVLFKFTFNDRNIFDHDIRYTIGLGTTYIENIPGDFPLAILNKGKEHLVSYEGDSKKAVIKVIGGHTYTFFYGAIAITVMGNFNSVSYSSTKHGFMGGENMLKFSDSCLKYECLHTTSKVRVVNMNGQKYTFNDHESFLMSQRYRIGNGTFVLTNVPVHHPIAFLNAGKTDFFEYTGNDAGLHKVVDQHTYKFYYGNVTLIVKGDFGSISFACWKHASMRNEGDIEYSDGCSVANSNILPFNGATKPSNTSSQHETLPVNALHYPPSSTAACPISGDFLGTSSYISATKPVAMPLRGKIACVDHEALLKRPNAIVNGNKVPATNVFGPFEAGFDSSNPGLNCLGNYKIVAGLDTHLAQSIIKETGTCNTQDIQLFGYCGGHSVPFHYHESMSCLYSEDALTGRSTRIGTTLDGHGLYGSNSVGGAPPTDLDGCNGRVGITPDSGGKDVYHYVVTETPPFTLSCFGKPDGSTTHEDCRALYTSCDMSKNITITTEYGSDTYLPDCPCFNRYGSNANVERRPLFLKPLTA